MRSVADRGQSCRAMAGVGGGGHRGLEGGGAGVPRWRTGLVPSLHQPPGIRAAPGVCSSPWGWQGEARPLALVERLEQTQMELINLSRSLAGTRQGAAGWLFGAPLIVTMTLTPDVTQHCPEALATAWGPGGSFRGKGCRRHKLSGEAGTPWTSSPGVPGGRHRWAGKMLPGWHHSRPVPLVPGCARPKPSAWQPTSPFILSILAAVGLSRPHFTDVGTES